MNGDAAHRREDGLDVDNLSDERQTEMLELWMASLCDGNRQREGLAGQALTISSAEDDAVSRSRASAQLRAGSAEPGRRGRAAEARQSLWQKRVGHLQERLGGSFAELSSQQFQDFFAEEKATRSVAERQRIDLALQRKPLLRPLEELLQQYCTTS